MTPCLSGIKPPAGHVNCRFSVAPVIIASEPGTVILIYNSTRKVDDPYFYLSCDKATSSARLEGDARLLNREDPTI